MSPRKKKAASNRRTDGVVLPEVVTIESTWGEVAEGAGLATPLGVVKTLKFSGVIVDVLAIRVEEPERVDIERGDTKPRAWNPEFQTAVADVFAQARADELPLLELTGGDRSKLPGRWLLWLVIREGALGEQADADLVREADDG